MPNNPFWKSSRGTWAVVIGGKQHTLGKDKTKAFEKFHALMAGTVEADTKTKATDIIEQYLDWSKSHQAESTYNVYVYFLKTFGPALGKLKLADLKPFHVSRWLDSKGYKGNTGNLAVRCVTRPFAWAKKLGIIKENPLVGVERPQATPREVYISDPQWETIMKEVKDEEFRDMLTILRETGCRPQEARMVEARHVHGRTWTFPREESKGKKRQRVVVLNDVAYAITQRLKMKHPDGKLFRNVDGNPWKANALICRIQRMRARLKKLGKDIEFCVYAIRHTWATNALLAGTDPLTVATLMGHADIKMIWEVYNKLKLQGDHLRDAANNATKKRKQA